MEQVVDRVGNNNSSKKVSTSRDIKLIVDYTKTIDQAIADGNYDSVRLDNITENFQIPLENIGNKVVVSAKLFWFNYDNRLEEIISEMDKAGYRPATIMELLALGALLPKLQKRFRILAPGSVGKHSRYNFLPSLDRNYDRNRRELIGYYNFGYFNYLQYSIRFLGVSK